MYVGYKSHLKPRVEESVTLDENRGRVLQQGLVAVA